MKKLNKVPKLKTDNGALIGGFASLTATQLNKVKGGKKRDGSGNNYKCLNSETCDALSGQNESCN